jgi:hypothetical protein
MIGSLPYLFELLGRRIKTCYHQSSISLLTSYLLAKKNETCDYCERWEGRISKGNRQFQGTVVFQSLTAASATFPSPRAALAIYIFVEGRRKKLIMSWTVSETVYKLKSIGLASIHLKMDNCTHP